MKGLIKGFLIGFVLGAIVTGYCFTWNNYKKEPIHVMARAIPPTLDYYTPEEQ